MNEINNYRDALMPHIWPVGGGKGGTGKSFLTVNIGVLLAKEGFKTLLIDADFGAPNLHTLLGMSNPPINLSDFLNKRAATLQETILEMPFRNLYFISGAKNKLDLANLAHEQKMKMMRAVARLDYDYILLDLGAGTSFNTIDFFTLSDSGIFVCAPEPTSIENIYRLIRSVYVRKIRQVLKAERFKNLTDNVETHHPEAMNHHPEFLLEILNEIDPEQGKIIEAMLKSFQFKLILNQLRRQDNQKTGLLICKVIEKHLGLKIQFAGNISFDERVHEAVCKKEPFIDNYPYSQATLDLKAILKKILGPADEQALAL